MELAAGSLPSAAGESTGAEMRLRALVSQRVPVNSSLSVCPQLSGRSWVSMQCSRTPSSHVSLPSLFVEVKCLYLAHPRLLSWKWLY